MLGPWDSGVNELREETLGVAFGCSIVIKSAMKLPPSSPDLPS
jgi:hypothetical protein